MKIKTIQVQNFKSIQEVTINCNKGMNAFIGKNGTGKSAVFEAVNFVLGGKSPFDTIPILKQYVKKSFEYDGRLDFIKLATQQSTISIQFYNQDIVKCNITSTENDIKIRH